MAKDVRFAFGKNWRSFLDCVDENRIRVATESLQRILGCVSLEGRTFLDVGCGSGLFSLAAVRLGATTVSFDYDNESVQCTQELKRRFSPDTAGWTIGQGSILDTDFLKTLPTSDVVYSWGVLHHTGAMWEALERTTELVKPRGQLVISIYNDQGGASRRWRKIKRCYNLSPRPVRTLMALIFGMLHETRQFLIRLVRRQNPLPFADWRKMVRERGMSPWHDIVDWIGGYPFEVARPEEIFNFHRERGFDLTYLTTQGGGYGCNEFAFRRNDA